MATNRKFKRYDGGGITEGENANIEDDVRARAMKFMQEREQDPAMFEAEPEVETMVEKKTKSKPKGSAKVSETVKSVEVSKPEPAKKMDILEEAKENARRRAAGSKVVRDAKNARASYGRGPGLSALKMAKGGSVGSASRRADGMATKGKTKGRMV